MNDLMRVKGEGSTLLSVIPVIAIVPVVILNNNYNRSNIEQGDNDNSTEAHLDRSNGIENRI